MGFTDKTPQYQACLKFIEAISPKHGTKHTEVVDLTSPTDEHMADNNNETPLINENEKKQKIDDNDLQDDEEHNKQEEEPSKEWKWSNTQKSHVDPKTQFVFIIFISKGMSSGMDRQNLDINIYFYTCFMLMYVLTIHMAGQSTLRDLLSNSDRMIGQTKN